MKPATRIFLLTFFLTALLSFSTNAQNTDSAAYMNKLKPLIGLWSGEGWVRMQDGTTHEFMQTEEVTEKLDGQIIIVNGIGSDKDTREKVFEAVGILSYSFPDEEYIFNTYTLKGQQTRASAKFEGDKLVWWFKIDRGTIQYEIDFNDQNWKEDGYFISREGQKYPFFHMALTKNQTN